MYQTPPSSPQYRTPRHVRLAGGRPVCVCCTAPRLIQADAAVRWHAMLRRRLLLHRSAPCERRVPAQQTVHAGFHGLDGRTLRCVFYTRPKAAAGRRGLALAVTLKIRRLPPPSSPPSPHSGPSLTSIHRPSVSVSLSCLPAPFPISLSLSFRIQVSCRSRLPLAPTFLAACVVPSHALVPAQCPRPSSRVSYTVDPVSPYTSLAPDEF